MNDWVKIASASPEWQLLTAFAIGLLIGVERERHKGSGPTRGAAGLRTFALVALLGGLSAQTGWLGLTLFCGLFIAAGALLAYWLGDRRDPGLTTEVAMVATFVLGFLTRTQPVLALSTAVVVTALLAIRDPIHRFVRDILSEQELQDGLAFFIAAVVVLPMLPDRTVDPFGLFNPHQLWRLAVVLMGLSAAGHGAVRFLGPRLGLIAAGIGSGFISSSAAIATMGSRARKETPSAVACATGAAASLVGSTAYLLALVLAADPEILRRLIIPVGFAITATTIYCAVLSWRGHSIESPNLAPGRAFDMGTVLLFAFFVGLFSILSTGLTFWIGKSGMFAAALATGLADVHAAAASIATLVAAGKIDGASGALAILCALSANMIAKIPLSFVVGPRPFAVRVAAGLIILLSALWSGYGWNTLRS